MTDRADPLSSDARLERERRFHDDLALRMAPDEMQPQGLGSLERAMLAEVCISRGMRVLDLGCGSGDLTLALLETGAEVTALDLSPGMIEVTRRRIARFGSGRLAKLVAAPVEASGLPAGFFDVIVGRFILHHLDPAEVAPVIARLLRPGGRAVFAENSARNPLLMAARKQLVGRFGIPRLGTVDEYPLTSRDIAAFAPYFARVTVTYPVFEFFRLFDRQILGFRRPRVTKVLLAVDRLLGRMPALRPYSFRLLVSLWT